MLPEQRLKKAYELYDFTKGLFIRGLTKLLTCRMPLRFANRQPWSLLVVQNPLTGEILYDILSYAISPGRGVRAV